MSAGWKVGVAVLAYVGFGIAGQLVLGRAMRQMPPLAGPVASEVLRFLRYVVTTPQVLLGVALLAVNFSALLLLLSRVDVSVVIPSSALSYLVLTLLAHYVLHETVPVRRWAGVLLITLGVGLVLSSTNSRPGHSSVPSRGPAVAGPNHERT